MSKSIIGNAPFYFSHLFQSLLNMYAVSASAILGTASIVVNKAKISTFVAQPSLLFPAPEPSMMSPCLSSEPSSL